MVYFVCFVQIFPFNEIFSPKKWDINKKYQMDLKKKISSLFAVCGEAKLWRKNDKNIIQQNVIHMGGVFGVMWWRNVCRFIAFESTWVWTIMPKDGIAFKMKN